MQEKSLQKILALNVNYWVFNPRLVQRLHIPTRQTSVHSHVFIIIKDEVIVVMFETNYCCKLLS